MTAVPIEPVPRCCDVHDDWSVLCEHLMAGFPAVPANEVVIEVAKARQAVERFALPQDEQFSTAELMARYHLMVLDGQIMAVARLDPESHVRRAAESA